MYTCSFATCAMCSMLGLGAFQVGNKMLLRDFTRRKSKGGKLDHKWLGPYTITGHLGKGLYRLQAVDNPHFVVARVNGAHLKPYVSPVKVWQSVQV